MPLHAFSTNTTSPLSQSTMTMSSPRSPMSPWLSSDTSDDDTSATTASESEDEPEEKRDAKSQAWFDALQSSVEMKHMVAGNGGDLEDLGRGAAELLDLLEESVWEMPSSSTGARSGPVASPSHSQASPNDRSYPTPLVAAPSKTTVSSSIDPVMAKARRRKARLSFTKTDLTDLFRDLEDLISTFENTVELPSVPHLPKQRASSPERTPTQRSYSNSLGSSPLQHISSTPAIPSSSPLRVAKTARNDREAPYADLFPSRLAGDGPFPTRRKSNASLRAPSPTPEIAPPVPTIVFPISRSSPPPPSSSPPKQSRYSVASSHASTSSSARSSLASSSGTDSFRWSLASGSTVPSTIAEGEEDCGAFSRRGSVATVGSYASGCSSVYSRRPSYTSAIPLVPHHAPSSGKVDDEDELEYEDFLAELAEECDSESLHHTLRREPSFASRFRKASTASLASKYSFASGVTTTTTNYGSLNLPDAKKSASSVSLHRIRSCASLSAPPPIPSRSTSLSKSTKAKGKSKAIVA